MIALRVQPEGLKHIRISGIDPVMADVLREVPEILENRDTPAAHARLFPSPLPNDEKATQDWQQMIGPDLRHLFVSAGESLTSDLVSMELESPDTNTSRVIIPVEHVAAWMTALNQARLILAAIHHVDEREMDRQQFDLEQPKQRAVLKIHLLGYLLHLFVELQESA